MQHMVDVPALRDILAAAIEEDYRGGDLTSSLCFTDGEEAEATIVARESMVVCGLPLVELIIEEFGFEVDVLLRVEEGSSVDSDTVLVELQGSAYGILAAERTILNFLERLCGVASTTRAFVESAGDLTILDTRKTLPGWRLLDKYATRIGGAKNHRMNLAELIMVKDTHIDALGGVTNALDRVFANKPYYTPVEVEVRDQAELEAALRHPVSIVMLDNFTDNDIAAALEYIRGSGHSDVLVEISGGVNENRLAGLQAFSGVAVSVGALTTQARNRDISMRVAVQV